MTKRQKNALETRQKIYETACSLIEEKGFANVSVEDITDACGVAKGTFYVYFKRKEDIVFECCKAWFSDVDRMAREHKGSIVEKLAFYFNGFMEGVTCGGAELCRQWVREVINPNDSPGEMCGGKYAYDLKHLTAFLKDAVKDGLLKRNTPVETLVHLFMSELYGMMTCWCMSDEKFVPEEWVGRFAKLQLPAILKAYLNETERN
ncbi:MAG: TetR/AcrR family transcriptional regulator [Kiritimatiellae bacterium]|nr:TetR/AcrR family transcriptional regulator [Kiritimatiellia bacterium]